MELPFAATNYKISREGIIMMGEDETRIFWPRKSICCIKTYGNRISLFVAENKMHTATLTLGSAADVLYFLDQWTFDRVQVF